MGRMELRGAPAKEGMSSDITGNFRDATDSLMTTASLISVTGTLVNDPDAANNPSKVINSREDQNMLNANDATIADNADGYAEFRLRLGPLDNINVGSTAEGEEELHILRLKFTYNDGVAVRTGGGEVTFNVCIGFTAVP